MFLEERLKTQQAIPVIIEFFKILSEAKEENISQEIKKKLKDFVHTLENQLNIKYPSSSNSNNEENRDKNIKSKFQPYLLIMIYPPSYSDHSETSVQFTLEAELLFEKRNRDGINKIYKRISIELAQEIPNNESKETIIIPVKQVQCSLNQIPNNVCKFITTTNEKYLFRVIPHKKMRIELFLPINYLMNLEPIEMTEISTGIADELICIGYEYKITVRSLDRFTISKSDYISTLSKNWPTLMEVSHKSQEILGKLCNEEEEKEKDKWIQENYFEYIENIEDDFNWIEKDIYLNKEIELNNKIGIVLICPQLKSKKNKNDIAKLFFIIMRTGFPLALWIRDGYFEKKELLKILTLRNLSDLDRLRENIKELRGIAYGKKQEKEKYLGYHLGFFCDNPNLIPYKFLPNKQELIEPTY